MSTRHLLIFEVMSNVFLRFAGYCEGSYTDKHNNSSQGGKIMKKLLLTLATLTLLALLAPMTVMAAGPHADGGRRSQDAYEKTHRHDRYQPQHDHRSGRAYLADKHYQPVNRYRKQEERSHRCETRVAYPQRNREHYVVHRIPTPPGLPTISLRLGW